MCWASMPEKRTGTRMGTGSKKGMQHAAKRGVTSKRAKGTKRRRTTTRRTRTPQKRMTTSPKMKRRRAPLKLLGMQLLGMRQKMVSAIESAIETSNGVDDGRLP